MSKKFSDCPILRLSGFRVKEELVCRRQITTLLLLLLLLLFLDLFWTGDDLLGWLKNQKLLKSWFWLVQRSRNLEGEESYKLGWGRNVWDAGEQMLTRAVAGLKGCRAAVKFPSYPHRQLHCFKAAAESENSSAQVGFWAVAARGAMSEGNEAHDHPGKKGSFGGLKRSGSTEHVQDYGRPSSDVSSSRNTQEGKPSGEPNRFDLPTQAVQPLDSTYDDEFPALGAAPSKPKRSAAAAVVNPSPVLTPVQTPQQSLRTQGGSFSYVPNQRSNTNNITASQPPYHDRGRAGGGGGREGGGRGRRAMDPIEALGRTL